MGFIQERSSNDFSSRDANIFLGGTRHSLGILNAKVRRNPDILESFFEPSKVSQVTYKLDEFNKIV